MGYEPTCMDTLASYLSLISLLAEIFGIFVLMAGLYLVARALPDRQDGEDAHNLQRSEASR